LGEGKPLAKIIFADPASLLDKIAMNVANRGNRAFESKGYQAKAVAAKFCYRDGHRLRLLGFGGIGM
jgi:hypothetical protein